MCYLLKIVRIATKYQYVAGVHHNQFSFEKGQCIIHTSFKGTSKKSFMAISTFFSNKRCF